MRLSFFFLLAICTLVAGAPSRRVGYVVHEKRTVEPVAWFRTRRLEAHKILPLRIGLTQQNIHELEELLMSVAHPDSPTFGQHWSPGRVMEHFAPSQVTVSTVRSWLIASGFHPARIRVSHNKGWIDVNATTSEVESLLDAEYYVYTHPSGHEQISPYSIALLRVRVPHV
jgi:tripeptidyl-peptidase-1